MGLAEGANCRWYLYHPAFGSPWRRRGLHCQLGSAALLQSAAADHPHQPQDTLLGKPVHQPSCPRRRGYPTGFGATRVPRCALEVSGFRAIFFCMDLRLARRWAVHAREQPGGFAGAFRRPAHKCTVTPSKWARGRAVRMCFGAEAALFGTWVFVGCQLTSGEQAGFVDKEGFALIACDLWVVRRPEYP